MSTATKYAIAQISIPIEIFPNGEWTNHNDRISIQIIRTSELPPISTIDAEQLQETIQEILGTNDDLINKIPLKFSEESGLPFIMNSAPSEDPPNTTTNSPISPPPPHQPVEYIDREELLARPRRQPSKNSSFKRAPYKSHNKTKRDWGVTSR